MQQGDQLVFVEVKARRGPHLDTASPALTTAKLRRLTTTIYHYLDAHQLPPDGWRLDYIAVAVEATTASIEHTENCLDW